MTGSPTPDWQSLEGSPEFRLLTKDEGPAERSFPELRVRSETGIGTDTAVTGPA